MRADKCTRSLNVARICICQSKEKRVRAQILLTTRLRPGKLYQLPLVGETLLHCPAGAVVLKFIAFNRIGDIVRWSVHWKHARPDELIDDSLSVFQCSIWSVWWASHLIEPSRTSVVILRPLNQVVSADVTSHLPISIDLFAWIPTDTRQHKSRTSAKLDLYRISNC